MQQMKQKAGRREGQSLSAGGGCVGWVWSGVTHGGGSISTETPAQAQGGHYIDRTLTSTPGHLRVHSGNFRFPPALP